ncbi:SH3 domain-containing protein, partial [Massariosphaeria phaeospora]
YMRATTDYDADDGTVLSFRKGDIIQVITEQDTGWWDGVCKGVRGWFPSNY